MIPRLQLLELEDQRWLPVSVRDLATDYLEFVQTRFRTYEPVIPVVRGVLERTRVREVLDLCSGGGGPIVAVCKALAREGLEVRATLTDKYPNIEAFQRLADGSGGRIAYRSDPLDATRVPPTLVGCRTLFNAFHHFPPRAARDILKSAVQAKQPIVIFEIPDRTLRTILTMLLTPVFVWLTTPLMRPFQWRRVFWTYVLPLVPLTCLWDGIVSQFRAYTVLELEALGAEAGGTYTWSAGRVPIGTVPGYLTYLVGELA